MRYAVLVLLCLASWGLRAQDFVLVPIGVPPVRLNTSTATLTPDGVHWTFSTPKASVTLTPRGDTYTTFRSLNSTVTLTPKGTTIFTVQGR